MNARNSMFWSIGLIVLAGIAILVLRPTVSGDSAQLLPPQSPLEPESSVGQTPTATPVSIQPSPPVQARFAEPIAEFRPRLTKKLFGTYVTPDNSPVQPEKFTGYHTAVDVEYDDTAADVPVYAIEAGEVEQARYVSGYGGLLVIRLSSNEVPLYAVYGHLRPSSLPSVGSSVARGQQVGLLGTAYSPETDGERRHLHFGLYTTSPVSVRGYVSSEAALNDWVDPLSVY